jgi:pleckstrin family protein A (phosphoinositide binding specific) protein 8
MSDTNHIKNVFFYNCVAFPTIDSNLIETTEFLRASKDVVKFVELLGKAFIPVRNDINGNIEKLNKIYESNPSKYKYLNEIVKTECETLSESDFKIGTDALIWLTRALNYNQIFLSLLLCDFEEGKETEDLSGFFSEAYERSLKKYHNWLVQKICSLCLLAAPNRTSLLKHLTTDEENIDQKIIFSAIKEYLITLKTNILAVNQMFDELKIDY